MSESPLDRIRAQNILTLTGASIALSTLVFFFASSTSFFSFDFGPPVSLLTIIYHATILILSRRHRNSPNPSPYPTMRPAIGLAAFLFLAWLITTGFMIASLALFVHRDWARDVRFLVRLWAQFILTVVETGVMLSITLVCASVRRSLEATGGEAAEGEGRIQI